MRLFPAIAAVAVLMAAPAAFAQDAAAPAPTVAAPSEPDVAALEAELEAASETIKPVLEALDRDATAIRNDAAIPEAEKEGRIRALVESRRADMAPLIAILVRFIGAQAAASGAPADQIPSAEALQAMIEGQLVSALLSGEDITGE